MFYLYILSMFFVITFVIKMKLWIFNLILLKTQNYVDNSFCQTIDKQMDQQYIFNKTSLTVEKLSVSDFKL